MNVNDIQIDIASRIETWFTNNGITINAAHIFDYLTTPDPDSTVSPYWVIVSVIRTNTQNHTVDPNGTVKPLLAIWLHARINTGSNAETTRAAAERWLNDAEETIVKELSKLINQPLWYDIQIEEPVRDPDRKFFGVFRTSVIPFTVEAKP